MRFSLASLLAITLLAALFMSLILQNNRTQGLKRELIMLKSEEQRLLDDAEATEDLLELCEEPIKAVTFPSETFKVVESRFLELQEKYGQLEIKDPNAIVIRSVPTYNEEAQYNFACRVFVPEDEQVELEMFASEKDKREPIERSSFDFSGTLHHSLSSGESLIKMHWDHRTEPATMRVVVNGETVLNATHAGNSFQGWGVQGINDSQFEFKNRRSVSLISFSARCQPIVHRFNIVSKRLSEGEGDE